MLVRIPTLVVEDFNIAIAEAIVNQDAVHVKCQKSILTLNTTIVLPAEINNLLKI